MMENRARICTAIALVLVVSVLAQANSAPAGVWAPVTSRRPSWHFSAPSRTNDPNHSDMESPLMPEHYIAIYKDDRTLSGGSGAA